MGADFVFGIRIKLKLYRRNIVPVLAVNRKLKSDHRENSNSSQNRYEQATVMYIIFTNATNALERMGLNRTPNSLLFLDNKTSHKTESSHRVVVCLFSSSYK
jgi:hypothetical protein